MLKILEYLGGKIILPGDVPPMVCDMGDYALVPKVIAKLGAGSSYSVNGPLRFSGSGFFLPSLGKFSKYHLTR